MTVIEEMVDNRKALEKSKIAYSLWEGFQTIGATPHSREGSTGVVINNYLYLFGGFSRDLY